MQRILLWREHIFSVEYTRLHSAGSLWCEAWMTQEQVDALSVPHTRLT